MRPVGPSLQTAYGTEENWCSKGQVLVRLLVIPWQCLRVGLLDVFPLFMAVMLGLFRDMQFSVCC